MSTEARDIIERLIADGNINYVLGWLASDLDHGHPFTIDALRNAAAEAIAAAPGPAR